MTEGQRSAVVVGVLALVMLLGYFIFLKPFLAEQAAVDQVRSAKSTWTVTMQQYLSRGPLSAQTYRVSNDDGKVTMFYSATNRDGTVTKQFDVPLTGPQATFLFEALRVEGLWDVPDKPLLQHPRDEYVFYVGQTLGDEGGHRAFSFSDPLYWAMTKGREYPIDPKTGIATSRPLRDPRYLKLVELMESFGPSSVQQAQAKIRAELAATNARTAGATKVLH